MNGYWLLYYGGAAAPGGPTDHAAAGTTGGIGDTTGAIVNAAVTTGTTAGTGDATGAVAVTRAVIGTTGGSGDNSGTVTAQRTVTGTSSGIGDLTGTPTAQLVATGVSDGVGDASGEATIPAAAITVRTETTATGTSGAPASVAKPSGLADGDIVYLAYVQSGSALPGAPTGFTQVLVDTTFTNPRAVLWVKVIASAAGEPATYDTTTNAGAAWGFRALAVTGADTTTPADVAAVKVTHASTAQSGVITPVTDGALVWSLTAGNSSTRTITDFGAPWTDGAELGERKNQAAWQVIGTAATTTAAWAWSGSITNVIVFTIAVRPVAVGGVTDHQAAGTTDGIGDTTGAIRLTLAVTGTTGGTGDATGAIQNAMLASGTADGLGAMFGTANIIGGVEDHLAQGTTDGIGAASGAIENAMVGAGTSSGIGDTTGAVAAQRQVAGTTGGAGDLIGSVVAARPVTGTTGGIGGLSGHALIGSSGTTGGIGGATGAVVLRLAVVGTTAGAGGLTGQVVLRLVARGTTDGIGGAEADATLIPSGRVRPGLDSPGLVAGPLVLIGDQIVGDTPALVSAELATTPGLTGSLARGRGGALVGGGLARRPGMKTGLDR